MQDVKADLDEPSVDGNSSSELMAATASPPPPSPETAPARNQPKLTLQTAVGNDAIILETLPVAASVIRLDPGLYAAQIVADGADEPGQRLLVSSGSGTQLDLLSAAGGGDQWFEGDGGIVAVRVPADGAWLTVTAIGTASPPKLAVCSVDALLAGLPVEGAAEDGEREIPIEVVVHIERVGDRAFPGTTWAGRVGDKRRIEGFSIRPLEGIAPGDIEYKALRPGGVETPWMSGTQFCGSRGQSVPLTGFAVRLAPHLQERFSVIYQAGFFNSGVTGLRSNGAPSSGRGQHRPGARLTWPRR
jgi:hypothetical protein